MVTRAQSYLPPKSQPWGRNIEHSISNVEQQVRINASNTDNNLKQLNSSINVLSQQQTALEAQQTALTDQQNRLAAFKTYSSTNASIVTSGTLNSVVNLRTLSTSFTLPYAAKVLISINSNGAVYGLKYATASNPTLRLTSNIVVDGSYQNSGSYGGGITASVSAGYVSQQWEGPAYLNKIVNLSAGSHSVSGNWGSYVYGDSGYASISESVVTVQVIELTG